MRMRLALLGMGAVTLATTACASTVSTSVGAFANAVPKPSSTMLDHPSSEPEPRGWLRAGSTSQSLIYVAAGNQIVIFPERGSNRTAIGAITDKVESAWGLFVDGRRNLYVANSTTITKYRPGRLHPSIVYYDPSRPLYVVLDHAGRLYAANRDGTVTEYPPRQTTPDITLQTPGIEADGINLDAANNLYVAYRGKSEVGSIETFAPNSKKGRVLGMRLFEPQALQLDRAGNILVVETGTRQAVDIFPPGSTSPSQIVRVTYGVTQIALRESEKNLYLSNFYNGNVFISRYPPGQFRQKIDSGLTGVQGMALSNEER
jgi:hypothetical protein